MTVGSRDQDLDVFLSSVYVNSVAIMSILHVDKFDAMDRKNGEN